MADRAREARPYILLVGVKVHTSGNIQSLHKENEGGLRTSDDVIDWVTHGRRSCGVCVRVCTVCLRAARLASHQDLRAAHATPHSATTRLRAWLVRSAGLPPTSSAIES